MAVPKEKRMEIPDGVTVAIDGSNVVVKGPKGELTKELSYPRVSLSIEGGEVVVFSDSTRKKLQAMVGTYAAHVANMIKGTTEGYIYKLKAVYAHFPMTIKVDGSNILIKTVLIGVEESFCCKDPGIYTFRFKPLSDHGNDLRKFLGTVNSRSIWLAERRLIL